MNENQQNEKEKNTSGGLLLSFIAGGIIGAAVALLYAPKTGKELRKNIKNKSGKLKVNAEDFINEAKQKVGDIINDGIKKSQRSKSK